MGYGVPKDTITMQACHALPILFVTASSCKQAAAVVGTSLLDHLLAIYVYDLMLLLVDVSQCLYQHTSHGCCKLLLVCMMLLVLMSTLH